LALVHENGGEKEIMKPKRQKQQEALDRLIAHLDRHFLYMKYDHVSSTVKEIQALEDILGVPLAARYDVGTGKKGKK
jgi:hypothetical protein